MRLIWKPGFVLILSCLLWVSAVSADTQNTGISVEVSGVTDAINKSVMDGLSIQRQRNSERLSERLVNRLHQSAQAEIRQTLTVYGYYNPTINADLQQTAENQWLASYQIEVGEPVRINDLQIAVSGAGEQDVAFQDLLADFPLKIDDRLRHARYESAKKDILRLAAE